ncbi:MAG: hypothetical protein HY290_26640 [Planctomycetia bacterium]|nr:hypothetical protein [Planctomycetia bacterium]
MLRILGGIDLLAFAAVVVPEAWIDAVHQLVGLGALPDGPIVGYLARSASAMYVLHGAIVVFISFDVVRYERLIRFMAYAALIHGAVVFAIDVAQQMPVFWRYGEGPCFAATGTVVLWLQPVKKQGKR